MSESGGCCRWCAGFLFTCGLTALFMWLSLRPSKPSYSIEEFYVPALNKNLTNANKTLNDTPNTTITFALRLRNSNKDKGIYYDDVNLTLYYGQNLRLVGNATVQGFYQGHKKKAYKTGEFKTVGVPWETAKNESTNKTAVFRVELATAVRFKIVGVKTKHHTMRVGGNVTVNDQGTKSVKKGVKLSCASVHVCYCARLGMLVLFVLLFLWY